MREGRGTRLARVQTAASYARCTNPHFICLPPPPFFNLWIRPCDLPPSVVQAQSRGARLSHDSGSRSQFGLGSGNETCVHNGTVELVDCCSCSSGFLPRLEGFSISSALLRVVQGAAVSPRMAASLVLGPPSPDQAEPGDHAECYWMGQ